MYTKIVSMRKFAHRNCQQTFPAVVPFVSKLGDPARSCNLVKRDTHKTHGYLHRAGESILRCTVTKVDRLLVVYVCVRIDLLSINESAFVSWPSKFQQTVKTGPKTSSTIVMDLGSVVSMIVGYT